MAKGALHEYEVTCVVTCRSNLHQNDAVSSSAIFLGSSHILAPGCLLSCSQSETHSFNLASDFTFEVALPAGGGNSVTTREALCITTWKCKKLSTIIQKLFSNDVQPHPPCVASEEAIIIDLISTFILLEIPIACDSTPSLQISEVSELSLGLDLLICSTPFGCCHVDSFCNSWSSGIVSKEIEKSVAFLSDASCVPGGQGGIVFEKESMTPAGIVLYPVIWKSEECTGLSILGSLSAILDSLFSHLKDKALVLSKDLEGPTQHISEKLSLLQKPSRVVRIRIGNSWGSGILISSIYVLTCSHVLRGHEYNQITVESGTKKLNAAVVFKSLDEDRFDVAVLKLPQEMDNTVNILLPVQQTQEGTVVIAKGYGLFQHEDVAGVSSGVVAKMFMMNSAPYKLITTCKVHSGSSGGAIMDKSGEIIAMITSNTYDSTHKTIYNDLSWGLSLHLLYPSIIQLCYLNDVSGFRHLEEKLNTVNIACLLPSKL